MMGGAAYSLGGECVRPPIGKATAFHALEDDSGAFAVRHFAGVVAQIEFAAVAVQMGRAQMVIGADHAALENREEILCAIGMPAAFEIGPQTGARHIEQIGLCALTNVIPGGTGGYEIYREPKQLEPEALVRKTARDLYKIMLWGSLINIKIGGVEVLQDGFEFCRELRDKIGAKLFDEIVKPHPISLIVMG